MKTNKLILTVTSIVILASCSKYEKSSTTGWEYNNTKNGGFEVNLDFKEQATGPGLVIFKQFRSLNNRLNCF